MFKTAMFAAAAICTVGLFSAPTAFAATTQVNFKDLDLATTAGQQQLESRIDEAARAVCTPQAAQTGSIIGATLDKKCYKQAVAQVRSQVAIKVENGRLGG